MLKDVFQAVQDAGKSAELYTTQEGSRLLFLPYGARVLGLFPGKDEENFFWVHPPLEHGDTAKALFAGSGWHNTGGDRTWISPELDTFFTDTTFTQYWQPRPLDMSDYAVDRVGGGIQMSRRMTLPLTRSNRSVDLQLTKWFGPAANPLRYERNAAAVLSSVQYAGYTQRVTLDSLDKSADLGPVAGIWNLAQLPAGGEMIVPLYRPEVLQKCFGDIPADRITVEDHALRIRADFSGSHKIAMKAAALCGRTGYVYHQGDRWSLVVRNFFVNLSGEYIDVQKYDQKDFGYAFQMCRVDEPEFGSFCEMEYHAPALGSLPNPSHSEDTSQIWAFRGTHDAIAFITYQLLGVKL
jgi:hypothetical protein